MQVWNQIKIVRTLERLLFPSNVLFLCLPLEALTQPLSTEVPGIPWSCDPQGWLAESHSSHAMVMIWKQLCSWEGSVSRTQCLCTAGRMKVTTRKWGTWFSQHSLLNFLELQVTPNPSCWSWQNFYRFTRYPPGVCWGRLPSHTYCLHSHCVRRAGRDVPSYAPMATSSFSSFWGEFWHAPSFQITGQSGRSMPRKPVLCCQ